MKARRTRAVGSGSAVPAPRATLATRLTTGISEEERHRILVDNCADALFLFFDDVLEYISPAIASLCGWSPEELVGRPTAAHRWHHPDDLGAVIALLDSVHAGQTGEAVLRLRHKDGAHVWVEARMRPLRQPDGRVGAVGSVRDVTERVEAQRALAEAEAHYRTLAELTTDVIVRWDAETVATWVSDSVTHVLGWLPEEIVGHAPDELVHPDDRPRARTARRLLRDGDAEPSRVELRFATPGGGWRWVSATGRVVRDGDGRVLSGVTWIRDVHAEVEARQQLALSEERHRQALHSAPVGTAVVGFDRRFLQVNRALCQLLGRDAAWLARHQVSDVMDAESDRADLELRMAVLGGAPPPATGEVVLLAADGRRIVAEHSVALLRDDRGIPASFVSQFVDVTDARHDRAELEFLASHDPLTTLANRRELLARLRALLGDASHPGDLAVLFCDLDGLKEINDTYGHAAGDLVLVQVAQRIRGAVDRGCTVARLAGDEFVVLVPRVTRFAEGVALAGRIHAAVARPLMAEGAEIVPTVSIGVALAQAGEAPEDVLNRADEALYSAKHSIRRGTPRA